MTFTDQTGTQRRRTLGLAPTFGEELQIAPDGDAILQSVARVSGGRYDPKPTDVFAADDRVVDRTAPLWSYFVLAALLLFVLDVVLQKIHLVWR